MTWVVLFLMGVVAWLVSTLGAGGGAVLFLPVATLVVDPRDVPLIIAIAAAISSVQRCLLYRREIVLPILGYNLPGLILGSLFGAWMLRGIEADGLNYVLGGFLVAYSLFHLFGWRVEVPPARPVHFGLASLVTASLSALVGASGPIMNPVYLQAGILKERMIGTKAASSLVMQIFKLVAFAVFGFLRPDVLGLGIVVGLGALVGNWIGKATLGRISGDAFTRFVQVMLLVSGVAILSRNLAS